jgi:hypothetical protein
MYMEHEDEHSDILYCTVLYCVHYSYKKKIRVHIMLHMYDLLYTALCNILIPTVIILHDLFLKIFTQCLQVL